MDIKILAGSTLAVSLLGLGLLAGSVVGTHQAFAQTAAVPYSAPVGQSAAVPYSAPVGQAAATPAPAAPSAPSTTQATLTQAQAEAAALAASPGMTVDHTQLTTENGIAVYDVDFTNGGGVVVNATTGAIVAKEAAGADQGRGKGGHGGGADQAALAAQATVTQQQAEQTALAAGAGNTVDHSRLGMANGVVFWDVDFSNGGGVTVNAKTGVVIATEAAGTDQGGHGGRGSRGGHSDSPSNGQSTPAQTP
ncbi:MAG: PepSY domain-containing protein [Chloroflexota bacterium]|nr:PepSY domain-containing protein [Chloroflexota bacterium]